MTDKEERLIDNQQETSEESTEKLSKGKQMILFIVILAIFVVVIIVLIILYFSLWETIKPSYDYNPYMVREVSKTSNSYTYLLKNDLNPAMLPELKAQIISVHDHLLNLRITNPGDTRWDGVKALNEVHHVVAGRSESLTDYISKFQHYPIDEMGIEVKDTPFNWNFVGVETQKFGTKPMINTYRNQLAFTENDIVYEVTLPCTSVFGLPQSSDTVLVEQTEYIFMNKYNYTAKVSEEGSGSVDFLLCRIESSKYVGLFMDVSNAHTLTVSKSKGEYHFKYELAGGIVNLKIFHAGDPISMLRIFHEHIKYSKCPPLWSFGFAQSREDCSSTDILDKIVTEYRSKKIPLDSLWMNQILMNDYQTFTVDTTRYPNLANKIQEWKQSGIHFVQTMLPQFKPTSVIGNKIITNKYCVKNSSSKADEPCFQSKNNNTGDCVFIDLLNNKTWPMIKAEMEDFNNKFPFDGLWIRQESPYTTCDGYCEKKLSNDLIEYKDVKFPNDIRNKTLPLESSYEYSANSTHFNVYNMYSLLNALTIANATAENTVMKTRVTSSVASPRLGNYATLWRGNAGSRWSTLKQILAETISFNMAGITFVGFPVCGYNEVPTELCVRWYQLAAYLPEMRVFHDGTSKKEPIELQDVGGITEAIKSRYSIIRFLYSKVYESGIWGGPVWMPLAFQFPNDDSCLENSNIDNSFIIGESLYVIPVLDQGKTSITVYFPNSHWYSLKELQLVYKYKVGGSGGTKTFDAPLTYTNVFIKGGSIIPLQNDFVMNTNELNDKPITLIVAPDHNKKASGTMVVSNRTASLHNHYSFTYINGMFRVNTIEGFVYTTNIDSEIFKEIVILDESLAGVKYACMLTDNLTFIEVNVAFANGRLTISAKEDTKIRLYSIDSITFGADSSKSLCKRSTKIVSKEVVNDGKVAKLVFDSAGVNYNSNFKLVTDEILYITIEPVGKNNWKVPDVLESGIREKVDANKKLSDFIVTINDVNSHFGFEIRKGENTIVNFSRDIVIEGDRFMKLDLDITGDRFYGLGERVTEFELKDGVYTLFSKGVGNPVETATRPGKNMYGSHPFYMFHISQESFAAIFILSSNPMDVWLKAKNTTVKNVLHALGSSVLELFYIQSNKPNELIANYHSLIGKPMLVPYWAFGYHQSRWGYDTQEKLQEVVKKFDEKKIPLDVLWSDIDYMYKYQDFTLDKSRFPNMIKFIDDLKKQNISYVPIVDAGIARNNNYDAYKDGLKRQLFIKSAKTKEPLIGIVWPGYAVFTDFTHPEAEAYWNENLGKLNDLIHMDGVWLDMNEATNFCDGECPDELHYAGREFTTDNDDMLIYSFGHTRLNDKVISMDALHHNSASEYDLHSMYGFYTIKAANKYFQALKKRPFILSRSSHPGSGRYGTHWLGDNYSLLSYMKYSLAGIYNFQMFGIPMVGADVCGFAYQVDMPLCLRWMEMGAFYPFFRNHKEIGSGEQEPYVNDMLTKIAIYATKTRYGLFRYLYSQYFYAALYGGTFFTPVFWYFPQETESFLHNEETFMIGSSLKVSPCFNVSSQLKEKSYFPNANWYNLFTGAQVMTMQAKEANGSLIDVDCTYEPLVLNVHIRGGSIIPFAEGNEQRLMKNLMNHIDLIVVPYNNLATGTIYYDDNGFDTIKSGMYKTVTVNYQNKLLSFNTVGKDFKYEYGDNIVDKVKIFNAKELLAIKKAVMELKNTNKTELVVNYNATYNVLSFSPNSSIEDIKTITLLNGNLE